MLGMSSGTLCGDGGSGKGWGGLPSTRKGDGIKSEQEDALTGAKACGGRSRKALTTTAGALTGDIRKSDDDFGQDLHYPARGRDDAEAI